ncbi:MAG: IS701 family transposase [Acidobacteriota bacterium]
MTDWLEVFEPAFGHRAQRGGLRRYVEGVLSDSRRKSMEAMWARLRDPGSYQALQYFITEADWSADRVWRCLRAAIPARSGVLVLDGTGFPKQGHASVGVQRQYSGTLGKIGNCQVAVTAALWTGVQAWLVGAQLYLPVSWLTPAQRARGHIPVSVVFQEKWRQALTLLRQVRAAGIEVTAVVADAEFGDCTALRHALHTLGLPYALGVSCHLTVFEGTPQTQPPPQTGRGPRASRPCLAPGVAAISVRALAAASPARAWRTVSWRNGTHAPWRARFWACRVTPAHDWRTRRVAPAIWLLCQRDLGATPETKYYFVHLPATASLTALVRLSHQRWAIEQQYAELKDELGLDHFEGRSFPGWHRHVVLTAIAYAFIQRERQRQRRHPLTFPQARAVITDILTAHYFLTHRRHLHMLLKLAEIPLRT